jgi:hypothetical protein
MKLWAECNGLLAELLCLSRQGTVRDENANPVALQAGMPVAFFQKDGGENETRGRLERLRDRRAFTRSASNERFAAGSAH